MALIYTSASGEVPAIISGIVQFEAVNGGSCTRSRQSEADTHSFVFFLFSPSFIFLHQSSPLLPCRAADSRDG